MPNISGLYSQSTGLPPSDWKIIQAPRFLCSDAVFFRCSDFFLPTAELERMCLKDIEQHCIAWEEVNTWSVANQIAQRIHDESGPGKNDFLISLASYHRESHILLHLSKYLLNEEGFSSATTQNMRERSFFKASKDERCPCEARTILP